METKTQRKKRRILQWLERWGKQPGGNVRVNPTAKGYQHSKSKYANKLDRKRQRFLKRMENKNGITIRLNEFKFKSGRRKKAGKDRPYSLR